jgi:hypothetical protein
MTPGHDPHGSPAGPPLGDDELGRLIAGGLSRRADGPVDERSLVAGARAGAVRIRRRRSAAAVLAAVVVVGLPAGLYGQRLFAGGQSSTSAGRAAPEAVSASSPAPLSAQDAGSPASAAGPAPRGEPVTTASADAGYPAGPSAPGPSVAGPSAPGGPASSKAVSSTAAPSRPVIQAPSPVSPGAPLPARAPLPRTSSGAVAVPAGALLSAADLRPVSTLPVTPSSDTGNASPAPAIAAADVCGRVPAGMPAPQGSRAVTFERAPGTVSGWLISSGVRVFRGSDAERYLATLRGQQNCLAGSSVAGADAAAIGHGPADAQGRTHWFGAAATGRTVTEVRLVVPPGAGVTAAKIRILLTTGAGRLGSSGLAAAALADPSLG